MILIVAIISWAIYAYFDAKEEAAWSYPFRMFDWIELQSMKWKESKKAHRNGAAGIFVMLCLTSFLVGYGGGWFSYVAAFLSAGFTYWLVFDIIYAKSIGQKWHYLGDTAETGKLVRNGKVKAIVCLVIVATILTIHLL